MANQSPTQVVMSGCDVWYAPVGTAFPVTPRIDPSTGWKQLSILGRVVQSDAGVILSFKQTFEEFSGQGNFVLKAVRTQEEQTITVSVADTSTSVFALGLNNNTYTYNPASSGVPGTENFNTALGEDVNYISLLLRRQSPYSTDPLARQDFQIPKAYQLGEVKPSFKRMAAMIDLQFKVVRGPNATASDADVIKVLTEFSAPL